MGHGLDLPAPHLVAVFQKDMACLVLLREELVEETETYNEKELPH